MKILYIDGVGKYGGACRSLCENLTFLVNKKIEIMFPSGKRNLFPTGNRNLFPTGNRNLQSAFWP